MPNQARIPRVSMLSALPCVYRICHPLEDPDLLCFHMTNQLCLSSRILCSACAATCAQARSHALVIPITGRASGLHGGISHPGLCPSLAKVQGVLIGWFLLPGYGVPGFIRLSPMGTFAGFGLPRFKCPIMIRVLPVTRGPAARSRIAPPWPLQPL